MDSYYITEWIKKERIKTFILGLFILFFISSITVPLFFFGITEESSVLEKINLVAIVIIFISIGANFISQSLNKDAWEVTWSDMGIISDKYRYSRTSFQRRNRYYLLVNNIEADCSMFTYNKVTKNEVVIIFKLKLNEKAVHAVLL